MIMFRLLSKPFPLRVQKTQLFRPFFTSIPRQENFYEKLGVSKNATVTEIKSAYRREALKWHPDVSTANKEKAATKFREISEAYSTLSDNRKRMEYDLSLKTGSKYSGGDNTTNSPQGPVHQHDFTDVDAEEVFRNFMAGLLIVPPELVAQFPEITKMGVRMVQKIPEKYRPLLAFIAPFLGLFIRSLFSRRGPRRF